MSIDVFSEPSLRLGWCLFNSGPFKVVASVATFGILIKVVPALLKLSRRPPIPSGASATPFLDYSRSRAWAIRLGVLSIIGSLAAFVLWVFMYASLGTKTCDVDPKATVPGAPIIWLYAVTLLTALLFAAHWLASYDAKRRLDKLSN